MSAFNSQKMHGAIRQQKSVLPSYRCGVPVDMTKETDPVNRNWKRKRVCHEP